MPGVSAQETTASASRREDRPPRMRLLQGALLVAGVVVLALVVGDEASRFYLVPLSLGLVYLSAALAGGPRGGYWATTLVLLGFGTAAVVAERASPELENAGVYLLGAGAGALVGAVLSRRGVAVDPLGAAGTVLLIGLVLALTTQVDLLVEMRTFAVLVGLVGLANVAAGAAGLRR
jgi:hypothetical protein